VIHEDVLMRLFMIISGGEIEGLGQAFLQSKEYPLYGFFIPEVPQALGAEISIFEDI
jgi:hypothetical protein